MPKLTPEAFKLLLFHLAADPEKAAEEYLDLYFKLEKYFDNRDRGRFNADHTELIDDTLNRVAEQLEKGVNIEKNIYAFTYGTARLVWLEYLRQQRRFVNFEETPEQIAPEESTEEESEDERMACLRSCLIEVTKDDAERKMLLEYYDAAENAKNKDRRKSLAEKLGIKLNALKTRMCRLRDKLEKCVTDCVGKQKSDVTF